MISHATVTKILDEQRIGEPTRSQILHLIRDEPARTVGGHRSVRGKFRSQKMDCTLQTESRTVEHAVAVLNEYDPDVQLHLDQPCTMTLQRPGGGPPIQYTPDFFVLSKSRGAELLECKQEDELIKLSQPTSSSPWRYIRVGDGSWRSPPAEEAAAKLGLKFRVISSRQIPRTLQRNIEYLAPYFDQDIELDPSDISKLDRIKQLITERPGITHREVLAQLGDSFADILNYAIAKLHVFVELRDVAIADNFSDRIFLDQAAAEMVAQIEAAKTDEITAVYLSVGAKFIDAGKEVTVVSLSPQVVTLVDDRSDLQTLSKANFQRKIIQKEIFPIDQTQVFTKTSQGDALLHKAKPDEIAKAVKRYHLIAHVVANKYKSSDKLSRTQQRYIRAYRDAEETLGVGLVGLLPSGTPGNRTLRVDSRVEQIIQSAIDEKYLTPQAISKETLWGIICERCNDSVPPLPNPSRKTINRRIKKRSAHKVALARFGSRAASTEQPSHISEADFDVPRYGEHAWSVAHADHTQLDVELVSERGHNLGRPWLSTLISPKYNRLLARFITFDPPSYRSCLGLLRDCVERHQRLPQVLITDNGADFQSNFLNLVLCRFGIHQQFRPPGQPRYGAVLERFNGTINTKLIHSLDGQTRLSKAVRLITKSHNPKRLATMTFAGLSEVLDEFLFEFHDTFPDPITRISPREAFADDEKLGGSQPHLTILPDESFRMATLPSTKSGLASISPGSGITIDRIAYWHPELRLHLKSRVPVRYDPHDLSVAYAQLDGKWVQCVSRKFRERLRGVSEKERQIVSVAYRRNAREHESHRQTSATRLARLLQGLDKLPEAKIQAEKQREEVAANPPENYLIDIEATVSESKPPAPKLELPAPAPCVEQPTKSNHLEQFSLRRPKTYTAKIVSLHN